VLLIYLLQAIWLLSACKAVPLPDAVPNPSAADDPTEARLVLTGISSTPIPVLTTPTLNPTVASTPTLDPLIPDVVEHTAIPDIPVSHTAPGYILPDSEVVYSPSAMDFNARIYLYSTRGFLRDYREYLSSTGWTSAADIIQRVALEYSINPRLLLALVEYQTGCTLGPSAPDFQVDYLMGSQDYHRKGLYGQLSWVSSQLAAGYYGYKDGTLEEIQLADGIIVRPAPDLNAGSVALQYYLAQVIERERWQQATNGAFTELYINMFGEPWRNMQEVEPLIPANLAQPEFILPFESGTVWSLTSGPHSAWDVVGAQAALDFAPATEISGCIDTDAWVVAVADGIVVRSEFGAVVQDLSGDGLEQTGWVILYMHIHSEGRAAIGTYLHAGDPVGHPSCEGGRANGTHLHIARKYNGEWIAAGGSPPFVMSGWTAHRGPHPYEGSLTRGKRTVHASPYGTSISHITRSDSDD
jgi:LasA protease